MANHKLEQLSRTDALTSLANRRYFDEYLASEWQRAKRDKTAFSLILCDVDCFKSYNDRYGHPAGDRCLQQVALALRGCFSRPADLVARYGGEEFAVVLPATELSEAGVLEFCRKTVADLQIAHEDSSVADYVTVSLGACTVVPSASSGNFESALKLADQALYRAKLEGRNRAILFESGH
jgi:diguanylate cyclase (GGDEF)-like protein